MKDPSGNKTVKDSIKSYISSVKSWFNKSFSASQSQTQGSQMKGPLSLENIQRNQNNVQKTTTWDSISNQRIKQLDSRVQQPAINFINNTESELNIQLRVNEGYRSIERQNELYNQSITTGPWVTGAKGGQSYHNYSLAMDVVIMESGKPNWNKPISKEIANIGIKQGFEWGGNWAPPKTDYPHFQMTFGQSWQELLANTK
jgi:LAS superfamily LD-carboxypeptidase LdcB